MTHAIILSVICGFAVIIGTLFIGCIFFAWLMARARKMFPRVEGEMFAEVLDKMTSVDERGGK
ncbi:MAG TPA: hypothetical protein VLH56_11510 [Dissulfurispiraceae bacterium]|nr:hypothetical protein [Dissulfurispiraceae bacterium]